jgi:hypothetical protein
MMPNYHEGVTNGIYCHEGATKHPRTATKRPVSATKRAQTATNCHKKVPPVPPPHTPPKQMPRWGEARHLLKNLILAEDKY